MNNEKTKAGPSALADDVLPPPAKAGRSLLFIIC
jgi:hypothetical protein